MKIQGSVKHAKLLTEKTYEQVDARKNLQYLAGVSIQIAKGVITDSEMKSFLKAVGDALSKFEGDAPCQFEIENTVISPDAVEMERAITEGMEKARELEVALMQGANVKKLVGG